MKTMATKKIVINKSHGEILPQPQGFSAVAGIGPTRCAPRTRQRCLLAQRLSA